MNDNTDIYPPEDTDAVAAENMAITVREAEPHALAIANKPPVTAAQAKIEAVANLTAKAYERASMLNLTPEERAALQAPFPDSDFQPGAAGKENLIYIQHSALRERFNSVIGMGQWAIIPRSRWSEDFKTGTGKDASRVYVEAMLLIRGCFVGEAVGDMVYYKNNDSQNFGDAVEGAKTAAFRRCAKELGVGLQAWDKAWCEGWWARKRGKVNAPTPAPKPAAAPPPPARSKDDVAKLLEASKAKAMQHLGTDEYESDFWEYARREGWILDTESVDDIPTNKLFPSVKPDMTYEQVKAAIGHDYQVLFGAVTGKEPPTEQEFEIKKNPEKIIGVMPADAQEITGTLDGVSKKTGQSAKGEWKRWGLKMGEVWLNTFDHKMGEQAEGLKGMPIRAWYVAKERGNDLLKLEAI